MQRVLLPDRRSCSAAPRRSSRSTRRSGSSTRSRARSERATGAYLRKAIRDGRSDEPRDRPGEPLAAAGEARGDGRVARDRARACTRTSTLPEGSQPIGPSFACGGEPRRRSAPGCGASRSAPAERPQDRYRTCSSRSASPARPARRSSRPASRTSEQLYSAWFVGFAPYDAPRYAFAVLLDRTHDGKGADAAPVTRRGSSTRATRCSEAGRDRRRRGRRAVVVAELALRIRAARRPAGHPAHGAPDRGRVRRDRVGGRRSRRGLLLRAGSRRARSASRCSLVIVLVPYQRLLKLAPPVYARPAAACSGSCS